tara:strand:- start:1 stop:366 length:366 start_codon:yes stop_codon:yes gene_type:complete
MMLEPTTKTVGTKYSEWNGNIGSITEPALSERAILKLSNNIRGIIIANITSIGPIIDDIACAWASPGLGPCAMYIGSPWVQSTLRLKFSLEIAHYLKEYPQTTHNEAPSSFSVPQIGHPVL